RRWLRADRRNRRTIARNRTGACTSRLAQEVRSTSRNAGGAREAGTLSHLARLFATGGLQNPEGHRRRLGCRRRRRLGRTGFFIAPLLRLKSRRRRYLVRTDHPEAPIPGMLKSNGFQIRPPFPSHAAFPARAPSIAP